MSDYQELAQEFGGLSTGIHTRLSDEHRISSCYRRFSNPYFESWGWETLLWKNDEVKHQYDVVNSADQVLNLHSEIMKRYLEHEKLYED